MSDRSLTPEETEYVLSAFPSGSAIAGSFPFTSRGLVALPRRVVVQPPDGGEVNVVLREARYWPGIYMEAELFPWLADRIPVPEVLAAPRILDDAGATVPRTVVLLSMLPGLPLDRLIEEDPTHVELLFQCRRTLHGLTDSLLLHPAGRSVPRVSLESMLWEVTEEACSWSRHLLFERAVRVLIRMLPSIREPLVFSNGDLQPGNFLVKPPEVTGYLDFEYAAFEDPLMALAKRKVYAAGGLQDFDLSAACLDEMGRTKEDLAPRVALRCLVLLSREEPLGDHVVRVLSEALDVIGR